jgi:hypothetical protein
MRAYTKRPEWKAWYKQDYAKGKWREKRRTYKTTRKYKEWILEHSRKPETRAKLNAYHKTDTWKAYMKKYRQTPKFKEMKRRYKALARVREYDRAYAKSRRQLPHVREGMRLFQIKRRAKERRTDITAKWLVWLRGLTRECQLCGCVLTDGNRHLDHVRPLCVGGDHTKVNVRFICADCNNRRPRTGRDVAYESVRNLCRLKVFVVLDEIVIL